MGTLKYDDILVEFDDRLLAHLQLVIVQKLRRGESFLMSWRDSAELGNGHSSIWIHPSHTLYFKFVGGRTPDINPEWVQQLVRSANSTRGLLVLREGSQADVASDTDIQKAAASRMTSRQLRAKADPPEGPGIE